jgi:hypothetical protein
MDHPDELEQIARRGTAFAQHAFGWETIVEKLSTVYESAVARRRASKIETGAKT